MGATRQKAVGFLAIIVLLTAAFAVTYLLTVHEIPQTLPIKIGFANTLTGKASTWGVASRNGAMLAVEQANKAGGINGRPIELIIRDDKGDPQEAVKVDRELMDKGVVAILGHFLSTVAVHTVDQANQRKVMIMGLSTTTSQLTGKDDYLLRISLPIDVRIPPAAKYSRDKLKWKNMALVLDESNPNYTVSTADIFQEVFEKHGGKIVKRVGFHPAKKEFSAPEIARQVVASNCDGVFIITNGIHGALICQHIRKQGSKMGIMMGGWAFSDPDFTKNGGKAVEGAICFSVYNARSTSAGFWDLKKAYKERFGDNISEAAQNGYDATQIVIEALKNQADPAKLPQAIKNKKFAGSEHPLCFDEFGDVIRPIYILEVKNGMKVTIGQIIPEELKEK